MTPSSDAGLHARLFFYMAKIKKPQKRGAQLVHGVDRLQK
jgi:hypothetical protein